MAAISLTPALRRKLMAMFGPSDVQKVEDMLATICGEELTGQGAGGGHLNERMCAAALKLSEGSLERLHTAAQLACRDWRDALVAARFGEDLDAHLAWLAL